MGLLSFFKRVAASGEAPAASSRPDDTVGQARTRARHRLIGAVVLVGGGVIGFPMLFETEPRPVPTDLPIEIPAKETPMVRAPALLPAPAASAARSPEPVVIEERAADAGREVPAPEPSVAAAPASAPPAAPRTDSAPSPAPARDKSEAEAARARALLEGRPAAQAEEAAARYVVQVGAYSETASAREVRAKVEKLGFKTYTQVVDTAAGQRIRVRVGPFASRDKAQQAADRLKAAGLPGAVLTL